MLVIGITCCGDMCEQPKMENLREMGVIGESYDSGLMGRVKEDEFDSRSGSDNFEAGSGDDQNTTENKSSKRKKKYHRHTAFQIQELEAYCFDSLLSSILCLSCFVF